MEINNWQTGEVICEGETTKDAIEAAIEEGVSLSGAHLSGAHLRGANLNRADLGGASLNGADLSLANLSLANLDAASLVGSSLIGADLSGADLRGALFNRANLSRANLSGAYLSWSSHDLMSEILLRAAGNDIEKLMIAGLVLVSRTWCWYDFLAVTTIDGDWATQELAKWIQDGDGHPECLDSYIGRGGEEKRKDFAPSCD